MSNQEPRGKGLIGHLVPKKIGFQSDKERQNSKGFNDCSSTNATHEDFQISDMQVVKGLKLAFKAGPSEKQEGLEVGGPSNILDEVINNSMIGLVDFEPISSVSGGAKVHKPFNWKRVAHERRLVSDLGEKLKLGKRGNSKEGMRDRAERKKLKKVWKERDEEFSRDGEENLGVNEKSVTVEKSFDSGFVKMPTIDSGVEDGSVMEGDVCQVEYVNVEMVTSKTVLSKAENMEDQSLSVGRSLSIRRAQ
ncbi:hypothetical protein LWI28_015155 [Acer negundo]|uniref:Uncharacterized protein n=1 Tax=Acer negundo TaxID=4023 RepID=A0AAD5NFH8_ACENE|nr:hypothetical protein LWI28_015155 [Acer negundo]